MKKSAKKKLGPVSVPEWRASFAAIDKWGSDARWGRPEEGTTARGVWELMKEHLPCTLDDLRWRSKSKKLTTEEYDRTVGVAKQSLVVALDCAITAGDRGAMLTKNLLFDALALRWSRRYRRARRKGARVSYDMRPATVERALRELLEAGVRFDTLWEIVTGCWLRKAWANPLFSVRRTHDRDGKPLGWKVTVRDGSLALRAFEDAVECDRQYHRRGTKHRLLLEEDWTLHRRPRQKICEERPYNAVKLGAKSEEVLEIQESTRVLFNVETFRDDYETLKSYLESGHRPSKSSQWRNYRKLKAFVKGYRRLYQDTSKIPIETIDDFDGPPEQLPREVWIRSRFSRNSNRRYQSLNFWPDQVQKDPFRARWFSIENYVPEDDYVEPGYGPYEPMEHVVVEARTAAGRYVELDITVSQIQTLAAFLGITELEALATSSKPSLKEWLAARIWALHERTPGGLLADGLDGYTGANDARLIAFAKAHLMRFYGGDLAKITRKCWQDPAKYGPGWRTTNGPWAKPKIKPGTKRVVLTKSSAGESRRPCQGLLRHAASLDR